MRILVSLIFLPIFLFGQIEKEPFNRPIKVSRYHIETNGKRSFNKMFWEELGPLKYPGTEKEYSLAGVGPVKNFQIHPISDSYCGLNSIWGGLFLSKDGGESWFNSGSDEWISSQCAWFTFHPKDPNIIAAISITESTKNGGLIGKNGGIMLSFDFGKTWKRIANVSHFDNDYYTWVFKVILTDDFKCYVATSNGLYVSTDINADYPVWNQMMKGTNLSDIEKFDDGLLISGRKKDSKEFFIRYLNSEDNKFEEVPFSFEAQDLHHVKFESVQGKTDEFYYIAQYDRKPDLLVKSNLHGNSKVLNNKMHAIFGYGLSLAVDPNNDSIIFAGAGTGLQKSTDGGKTFKYVKGNFHLDIEGINFHPNKENELYIFTHGGLYKSDDLGATWENRSKGVGIGEVMGMGVGYNGFPIAIGLFHDGSLVYSKDSIWRHITPGDGLNSYVAYDSSNYVYISNQHNVGGFFASKDSGKTFVNISKQSRFKTSGWSMSFVQNTSDSRVLYFNYKRKPENGLKEGFDIILSKNRGFSEYYEISDFFKTHKLTNYNLLDLYVNPNKPGTLYAYLLVSDSGEHEHRLFKNDSTLIENKDRVQDFWKEVKLPVNSWIADIEFNPFKDEEIFVVQGSKRHIDGAESNAAEMVYKIDLKKKYNCLSGKNCKDITWNLPNAYVEKYASYVDVENNKLYLGTNRGLYSLDLEVMESWEKVGKKLPNVIIRQIQKSGDGEYLYVGTKGRGVWRLKL